MIQERVIEIEKSLILTEKVSHYGYFSRSDSWLSADQHWMKQVGKSTLETTPRFVGRNLASEGDDIAKRPTDWQRANVSPFSAEKQRDENAPSISHLPLGGKRSRRRKRYLFRASYFDAKNWFVQKLILVVFRNFLENRWTTVEANGARGEEE